jgi:hypothetical protein
MTTLTAFANSEPRVQCHNAVLRNDQINGDLRAEREM